MIKYWVGFILFGLSCTLARAQDDCEQVLTRATDEFNSGHFYGLAAILKPCIDNGFSREQRQRAYLLLAQAYLLLDDPIGAEDSYLKLLQANPEFVTDRERDPIEIVYLSSKFTSTPIFSLYAKLGGNTSVVRVIHDISTTDPESTTEQFILKPGWQFSGGADLNLNDHVSLSLEGQYSFHSYKAIEGKKYGQNSIELVENQHWVKFPVSLKYTHHAYGKTTPYLYAGYSIDLLLGSQGNFLSINRDSNVEGESQPTVVQAEFAPENLKRMEYTFNSSVHLGVGAKYKIGLDYVFAELKYSFGLTNIVNPDKLYSNANIYGQYGYAGNLFRLDNAYFSIGFMHPLYKPRKLKKARSKGILRRIINQKEEQ